MISVLWAIVWWILITSPLLVTGAAFLDAARRPAWAWGLSQRNRLMWLTSLVGAGITIIAGPIVAIAYFVIARPDVAAAERGELS